MVDQAHADREHATWSASSTDRNMKCPGNLALVMHLPDDTNEAADWGTCCHQLSEKCFANENDAIDYLGTIEKGKKYENEVDEEMAETAQMYVDYVRKQVLDNPGAQCWIEQRFSLDSLSPPFDAGGTGDAVLYYPDLKMIEAVDLKGGRGVVVQVKGNGQARTYTLGALLANEGWAVDKVKSTIVQPRADHPDGRIRSEVLHVSELIDWTADLRAAWDRTNTALFSRETMEKAVWEREFLVAGPHCKFCKYAGTPCPAREQKSYDDAGLFFTDLNEPKLYNTPEDLSIERLVMALDACEELTDFVKSVNAYAHRQAEAGVDIPGYQLVDKVGHRKFTADDAEIEKSLRGLGIADPFTKNLMSPAQAEAAAPGEPRSKEKKAAKAKIVAFTKKAAEKPVSGTKLVRADKTTRPAVQASVHKHFDVIKD